MRAPALCAFLLGGCGALSEPAPAVPVDPAELHVAVALEPASGAGWTARMTFAAASSDGRSLREVFDLVRVEAPSPRVDADVFALDPADTGRLDRAEAIARAWEAADPSTRGTLSVELAGCQGTIPPRSVSTWLRPSEDAPFVVLAGREPITAAGPVGADCS